MTKPGGVHALRANARRRLGGRRRTAPGMVLLLLAAVLFLASIGLTLTVAFSLEHRIAAIETFLGIDEQ